MLGNDLPGFVVSVRGSTWKKLMTAAGSLVTASALFITIYNDNIGVVSLWNKKAPFTGAFISSRLVYCVENMQIRHQIED